MPAWRVLDRLKHWLKQWRGLAPWERGVLLRLAWRLPAVWIRLRVYGFKTVFQAIETEKRPTPAAPIPPGLTPAHFARRCAQLCEVAARHGLYRANCLHQSLALCSFLRRTGLKARLQIGVLPGSKPFQAHAWVELDSVPLGKAVNAYRAFPELNTLVDLPVSFDN